MNTTKTLLFCSVLIVGLLLTISSVHATGPCAFPATGIQILKQEVSTYHICTSSKLRWVVTGDHNPGPSDTRHKGRGSIRLRELYYTTSNDIDHQLLSCANCDVLMSVRKESSLWAWTGPGYGREGQPLGFIILLDGRLTELQNNIAIHGSTVEFRQVVAGYAEAGVLERESSMTIDTLSMQQRIRVRSLSTYEIGTIYAGRLEAPTLCTGGPWYAWMSSTGQTGQLNSCTAATTNLYWFVGSPTWIKLTSPSIPIHLLLTVTQPLGPCIVIFNRAYDYKLKPYCRPVNDLVNPLIMDNGDELTFDHVISVFEPVQAE